MAAPSLVSTTAIDKNLFENADPVNIISVNIRNSEYYTQAAFKVTGSEPGDYIVIEGIHVALDNYKTTDFKFYERGAKVSVEVDANGFTIKASENLRLYDTTLEGFINNMKFGTTADEPIAGTRNFTLQSLTDDDGETTHGFGNKDVSVAIKVSTVNDQTPVMTITPLPGSADYSVQENATDTIIGKVSTTDGDIEDKNSNWIYKVSDSRFIVDAEGNLKLASGASLDFEKEGKVTLEIGTTDKASHTTSTTITVNVKDINDESPVITVTPEGGASTFSVDENAKDVILGSVGTVDKDAEDASNFWTYTVSDSRFIVDAEGNLKLASGASLDFEKEGKVTLEIETTDNNHHTATQSVTILVNDINEAPEITVTPVEAGAEMFKVDENVKGAVIGSITTTDGDADDTQTEWTYTVSDDRFEVDGDGNLRLKEDSSLDYETSEDGTVRVTVTTMDGAKNIGTTEVAISVQDQNDAPVVKSIGVELLEDSDYTLNKLTSFASAVEDQDGDGVSAIIITGLPASGALYHEVEGDWVKVTELDQGGLKISITDLAFYKFVPDQDSTAPVDVMFKVVDDSGKADSISNEAKFTFSYTSVNDEPRVEADATYSVQENQPGAVIGTFDAYDPEKSNLAFSFEVKIDGEWVASQDFEAVPAENHYTIKLMDGVALDYEKASSIEIRVTATEIVFPFPIPSLETIPTGVLPIVLMPGIGLSGSDEFELIVINDPSDDPSTGGGDTGGGTPTNPTDPVDPTDPTEPGNPIGDNISGTNGNDKLHGDDLDNRINGKGGNDKLWGEGGADTFVFGEGYGRDKIMDFDASEGDKIKIKADAGIESYDDLFANHMSETHSGHLLIALDDGSKLIIKGVDLDTVDADMFLL